MWGNITKKESEREGVRGGQRGGKIHLSATNVTLSSKYLSDRGNISS